MFVPRSRRDRGGCMKHAPVMAALLCMAAAAAQAQFPGGAFTKSTVVTGVDGLGSMAIGPDGLPLVVSQGSGQLRVSRCADPACTTATTSVLSVGGTDTSVAIGSDGLALLSHFAADGFRISHCVDAACTSVTSTLYGNWGAHSSVAIGADGL